MKTDNEGLVRAMADEYGRAGATGAPRLDRMRLALAVVRAHDAAAAALTEREGEGGAALRDPAVCSCRRSTVWMGKCVECGLPADAPVAAPVPTTRKS